MLHPETQLGVTTLLLLVRSCCTFYVDQVYGVEMCRSICQKEDCCFQSYDEKQLKCDPNLKYPIVVKTGSAEFAMCTVLTRRVHTRTRGEQVVTDCMIGYSGDLGQGSIVNSTLRDAYEMEDVCLVKYILTSKRNTVDLDKLYEDDFTVLMLAAYDGNKEMFDLFVREGANLTVKNKEKQTLLMLAIEHAGNIEIVKYILNNSNVDIHSVDSDGITSLFYSCIANNSAIFQLIIGAGGNLNEVDQVQRILNCACGLNNIGITRYILTHYNNEEHQSISNHINISLRKSITLGYVEIVDLLVNHGADLSILSPENSSMLAAACTSKNAAMVEYVLSKKCVPIDARDKDGKTPFLVAASDGTVEIMKLLVGNGCNTSVTNNGGFNALHYASTSGKLDHVEYILKKGFIKDVNSETHGGFTALYCAVESNSTDVFDRLVSSGADVAAVNGDGNTILHEAIRIGQVNIVVHILDNDYVSIESRGQYGYTPILTAAYYGQRYIFTSLKFRGCDEQALDDYKDNIFHLACCGGDIEMVKFIHKARYIRKLEQEGWMGRTPVLLAAYYGHLEIVQYLHLLGCNMSAVDGYGNNALHLAITRDHTELAIFLIDKNVLDVKLVNDASVTPLTMASQKGQVAIVKLLSRRED